MHISLFIFVLPFASGFALDKTKSVDRAPSISEVITIDPAGLHVEWSKLQPKDNEEQVLGYKVRLFERIFPTKYVFTVGSKQPVKVTTSVPQVWPASTETPLNDDVYTEQVISGADITKTLFKNLKLQTWYEVRVLAFSQSGDGPLSDPVRVKLG